MFRFELVAAMLTMIFSICLMTFLPQSIAVHHRISSFLVIQIIPQYLQLHNLLKSPNQ